MKGRKDADSIGAIMKKRMAAPEADGLEKTPDSVDPERATGAGGDDPLVSFNTRLPMRLQRALKVFCAERDVKQQVVVAAAIEAYLKESKKD
ncbi:MAG: hypothetical protein HC933_00900 [Pleurocapsa sp. SU_196_0]|nr:hypothetical protein [Pleurocapsa sp. SU_196_0]